MEMNLQAQLLRMKFYFLMPTLKSLEACLIHQYQSLEYQT